MDGYRSTVLHSNHYNSFIQVLIRELKLVAALFCTVKYYYKQKFIVTVQSKDYITQFLYFGTGTVIS